MKLPTAFTQEDIFIHNASISTSQKLKKRKYFDKILDETKEITLLTKNYDTKGITVLTAVIAVFRDKRSIF